MAPRRTTQAVRVGTAKGKGGPGPRRAAGYSGRTVTGGRGGLSDAALAANNRGSGGKGAPGTGMGGSAGGSSAPTGGRRPVVEETRSSGGTPITPKPPRPKPVPDRGFGGETVSVARSAAPVSRNVTVTKRVTAAPAKPPAKKAAPKPVAKKPVPKRGARHGTRAAAPTKKPTTRRPTTRRSTARRPAVKKPASTRTIGYTAPASSRK